MRWFVMKRFFARLLRTPSWHGRPAHGTRAGCTCHVCAQRVLQKSLAITLVASVLALLKTDMLCAQEIAPPFTRPQLETGEEVSLNDFRGQIVVLDFFNANCGDCVRVSWELETGIQEYYAARAGNPHGIAVQVIAINSEISDESDMEAFLRKTELGMVLDDPEGTLLEAYGGTSLPYLVLVDATAKGSQRCNAPVVLRQEKYEGLRKLRGAIDAITGKPEPPRAPTGAPAETAQEPVVPCRRWKRQTLSLTRPRWMWRQCSPRIFASRISWRSTGRSVRPLSSVWRSRIGRPGWISEPRTLTAHGAND